MGHCEYSRVLCFLKPPMNLNVGLAAILLMALFCSLGLYFHSLFCLEHGHANQTHNAYLPLSSVYRLLKSKTGVFIVSQHLPWFLVQRKLNKCSMNQWISGWLDGKTNAVLQCTLAQLPSGFSNVWINTGFSMSISQLFTNSWALSPVKEYLNVTNLIQFPLFYNLKILWKK